MLSSQPSAATVRDRRRSSFLAATRSIIEFQRMLEPIQPLQRPDSLPVSFAQELFYYLDQSEGPSAAYHLPVVWRLRGALDAAALADALAAVVERHEALRTTLILERGHLTQRIAGHGAVSLQMEDLTPRSAPEAQARTAIRDNVAGPFDLEAGPVLRGSLLRLADDHHLLVLVLHHIVGDGWSIGILMKELSECYRATRERRAPRLPRLPIQYGDYAVWERNWLQGPLAEELSAYWNERLRQQVPLLELPVGKARPPVRSGRGGRHGFWLPSTLSGRVGQLCRREGVTGFVVLLATFATLLRRLSGEDDLVIGTVFANRNRNEVEDLIGCFVNTVALRVDLGGDPTFLEVIDRVYDAYLGAYLHQSLPFSRVVAQARPQRDPSRLPLVQVMFVLQNANPIPLKLPGIDATPLPSERRTARFDLSFAVAETEPRLRCRIEYSEDLFEHEQVVQLARQFELLLEDVTDDPDRRLSRLGEK